MIFYARLEMFSVIVRHKVKIPNVHIPPIDFTIYSCLNTNKKNNIE